jgi:hypothetical protein
MKSTYHEAHNRIFLFSTINFSLGEGVQRKRENEIPQFPTVSFLCGNHYKMTREE